MVNGKFAQRERIKSMFTKRDSLVAILATCAALGITALAQSGRSVMGSSVFDWSAIAVKPTKTGARRDFFQAPTATLDELECHVTTLNPGEIPHPPHKHADEELVIVKDGTIDVQQANDRPRSVGPGAVIFQASNQMHGMRNVGRTAATYYVIRWKSPGMSKEMPKQ
jgi:XRE family transcriptional regulator, regulator of sulfur utilization